MVLNLFTNRASGLTTIFKQIVPIMYKNGNFLLTPEQLCKRKEFKVILIFPCMQMVCTCVPPI